MNENEICNLHIYIFGIIFIYSYIISRAYNIENDGPNLFESTHQIQSENANIRVLFTLNT